MELSIDRHKFGQSNFLLPSIILGAILGYCFIVFPEILFLFLYALAGWLIWRFAETKNRKFLLTLFVLGLCIRLIICLGLHYKSILFFGGHGSIFHDDVGIPRLSWNIARYYLGEAKAIYDPNLERNLHSNFLAILYVFFGYAPLAGKMVNIFLSVLSGILIFYTADKMFNTQIAKISASLVTLFPSLILWSITNLKETIVLFFLIIIAWAMVQFQRKYELKLLPLILLVLFCLFQLRSSVAVLLMPISIFSIFVCSKIKLLKKIVICMLALFILQTTLFSQVMDLFQSKFGYVYLKPADIINTHKAYVASGGSTYKFYDPVLYEGSNQNLRFFDPLFLKGLAKGWFYFMFIPLPWQITTKMQLISYPQVIIWISLLPFSALGILLSLRYNWRKSLFIILYIFFVTSIYALAEGNIGTAARHRDMFTPFHLIFASAGLVKVFNRKVTFKDDE